MKIENIEYIDILHADIEFSEFKLIEYLKNNNSLNKYWLQTW